MKGEIEEIRARQRSRCWRTRSEHHETADRPQEDDRTHSGPHLGNFQLTGCEVDNLTTSKRNLILHYKFTAEHYAKNTGGLLLVRPRVVGAKLGRGLDMTKPRHYPYEFDASDFDRRYS